MHVRDQKFPGLVHKIHNFYKFLNGKILFFLCNTKML